MYFIVQMMFLITFWKVSALVGINLHLSLYKLSIKYGQSKDKASFEPSKCCDCKSSNASLQI
jgi:hypothetical protein